MRARATHRRYSKSPDDETFIAVSKKYAHAHRKMWASKEFPDGITNGAAWYPLYGGQQDWDYIHTGRMTMRALVCTCI